MVLPYGKSLSPWIFTRLMDVIMTHLRPSAISLFPYLDDWLIRDLICSTYISHNILSPNSSKSRIHSKPKKVRFETSSAVHLHRDGISDMTEYGQGTTRSYWIPTSDYQTFQTHSSFGMNFPFSFGQTSFTTATNVSIICLETSYSTSGSSSSENQYDLMSFEMVDGHRSLSSGNVHPSSRSQCIPFHGCQPLWIGSSSQTNETVLSWSLEGRPIPAPHQQSRNNGHSLCTEESHTIHTPLLCYDIHRQYNSSLVYQAARKNTFSQPMHRSMGNPPLVPGTRHYTQNSSRPLSKLDKPLNTEWSLDQSVVNCIFQMLYFPNVDLFVTRFNHKLPLYVSPVPDNQVLGIDTLSMNWNNLHAYAFPPKILISSTGILTKIRQSRCRITLIASLWPQSLLFSISFVLKRCYNY